MAARKKNSELGLEATDASPASNTEAVDDGAGENDETARAPARVRVTVRHGCVQADREYGPGQSLHLNRLDAEALVALGVLEPW